MLFHIIRFPSGIHGTHTRGRARANIQLEKYLEKKCFGGFTLCAIRVPVELLWWLSSKEFACNVGDAGLIPWVRKIT